MLKKTSLLFVSFFALFGFTFAGLGTFWPYNCTHSALVTINGQSYVPNLVCGGISLGTGFMPNSALTLANATYNVYTSDRYLWPCKFTATTATTKTNFECIAVPDYIGLGATWPAWPAWATWPAWPIWVSWLDWAIWEVTYNLLPAWTGAWSFFPTGIESSLNKIVDILSWQYLLNSKVAPTYENYDYSSYDASPMISKLLIVAFILWCFAFLYSVVSNLFPKK